MRGWRFFPGLLGLVIGIIGSAPPARAIIIERDDGKKPIIGYVRSFDGQRYLIDTTDRDGKPFPGRPINKDKIKKYVSMLDEKRLGELDSRNPSGYWKYAEELAGQKEDDPEIRDTVKRLYLIAAKLDKDDKIRSKALFKLSALLDKESEKRQCLALAVLLDPKADAAEFFKRETAKPARPDKSDRALQDFVKALQAYRAGQMDKAEKLATGEGVGAVFSRSGVFELKRFIQWCGETGDSRPDNEMRLVLQAELWALNPRRAGDDDAGQNAADDPTSWSAILQSRGATPVLPLSLETLKIGGIDPRKCRRKDYKWVEE